MVRPATVFPVGELCSPEADQHSLASRFLARASWQFARARSPNTSRSFLRW